jgi:serine/threonine protein kinase/Tfp pilus assembly protein PilF
MGEVYRAKDLRLGREVAVKVLPEGVASSPDRLARFEREARTVAGLNHPNIVTLFSVEDEDGVRFLTMELVEGQTLANLVMPGGLPLARVLDLSIPLTDALIAAHERGVIHRDLKPGNVMVTRDGPVKVLDFGLAKSAETATPSEDTTTAAAPVSNAGEVMGTVPYMAPEQIRGEMADARTDLFALGIMLYELSTGRRPFAGETWIDVGHAILRDTPELLARFRTDLPSDLERVVSRCLEKDPRERIQSALDVNNELRRLRQMVERGEPKKPAPDRIAASIAVLPFVNRSASTEDDYFSEGLADELINVLAKIRRLRVSARASSFYFKGKDVSLGEIGRALNVATVLDGSVRKAGNRVRISVQLVKVSDGYHIWSETYDRTLDDIFAVQDDIAHSVVKELRTTLLGEEADSVASGQAKAEVANAAKGRGTHPEAYRLYLMARHLLDRSTRDGTAKAIEYLRQALDLDPELARAWVDLGRAYSVEVNAGWVPMAQGYGRARDAVERARALEPDLAEAHSAIGWIQMFQEWNWRGAEASIGRALELAPGNAQVLRVAGALAGTLGRLDEAIGLYRRALEQDPLSPASYINLAVSFHAADRLAEAEGAFRKVLEHSPQRTFTRASLSLNLLAQSRGEEALEEAMREPEEVLRLWALAIIHHALGHRAESDEALRELIEKYAKSSAYQIAEVHGARGETDAAFEWLERAYAQRHGGLTQMKARPRYHSLQGDPRWGALLKKMGFGCREHTTTRIQSGTLIPVLGVLRVHTSPGKDDSLWPFFSSV